MKTIILSLFFLYMQQLAFSQFAKITKFESGMIKDNYGNETSNSFRKYYFADGKTSKVTEYFPCTGGCTVLHNGLNPAKNALIIVNQKKFEYKSIIQLRIYYFVKDHNNKWEEKKVGLDPNFGDGDDGVDNYINDFDMDSGWEFSRVEGGDIYLTKDNIEYLFRITTTVDKKELYLKYINLD
jgi:hypothetical protein